MRMKSRWVLAGVVALFAITLNSCTTSNSTTTTAGTGFLWVATQGDQMVRSYNINLTTGKAAQVGTSVVTGVGPIAMAITPDGKTFFIANSGDSTTPGSINVYTFNSDGSLAASGTPVSAGQRPLGIAVDPTGALLFAADQASDAILIFAINSSGLAPKGSFPIQTPPVLGGSGPVAVEVSPVSFSCKIPVSGTPVTYAPETCFSLYVANQTASAITAYDYYLDSSGNFVMGSVSGGIFTTGGVVAGSPYQAGTNPSGLAFSRCAATTTATTVCPTTAPPIYLFVANTGSNDVSIFSPCVQVTTTCPSPNGTLTQVGSPVSAGGTHPVSFIVDPALDFVYAVDNGSFQVTQYKYSSATGALTVLSPAVVSTGASPLAGGITSDGKWVFIPNNGGSNLSAYGVTTAVGTTQGQLTPGTAISLSGQPSVVLVR